MAGPQMDSLLPKVSYINPPFLYFGVKLGLRLMNELKLLDNLRHEICMTFNDMEVSVS